MTLPAPQAPVADIMESVIIKGDLSKLTPEERVRYYNEVCKSLGLNPLTRPFEFIVLNGKLQLYANRTCADQLRKINSVSLQIVSREVADDVLTIHVRASLPDGRCDEDLGAVAFPATLKGDNRVNAELKAVTKAKRRATLSICGLGWPDETEIADIPAKAKNGNHDFSGDYADGVPQKLTEPPGPQTFSRRDVAEIFKCQSADELHEWGAAHSKQVNGYPADIKNKIYAAFNDRLAQVEAIADQVVYDSDDLVPRPARPEDFAEDTVEQIAPSISERAVKLREYTRPPNLQEVGPYDFPELPPELDRRK